MHYIRWPKNNFGDNLNDEIFSQLGVTQKIDFHKSNLSSLPSHSYLGLGTILNRKINSKCSVLGSGCNGTSRPKVELDYHFVRGPLTANYLGLDKFKALGDTAYFLKNWIQNQAKGTKQHRIGIIPHWATKINNENVISVETDVKQFIKEVAKCKYVLCEAMHGAICADILGVPWAPVKINKNFDEFKWKDWALSMDLEIEFGTLEKYKLYNSKRNTVESVSSRIQDCCYQVFRQ